MSRFFNGYGNISNIDVIPLSIAQCFLFQDYPLTPVPYGIQLVSESSKQDLDFNGAKRTKESRKHPRKPFSQTVRFSTNKELSEGITKNISAYGAFIVTEEKLEVGQLLKLNFPLKKVK